MQKKWSQESAQSGKLKPADRRNKLRRKATQKKMPGGKAGPSVAVNMPAVIYTESADKSARFIMDCNQKKIPIIFVHDTTGFMVGRDSEQAGIIRSGAKMVNAMSNCIVPKISLMVGGSYGAGGGYD